MAIKLISVKCPDCKANLKIEDDRKTAFCTYCGAKIVIDNDNEKIYRNIDEAEMKKAETDRIIKLKQMEIDENNRKLEIKVAVGVLVAAVLMILLAEIIGNVSMVLIGMLLLSGLLFAVMIKAATISDAQKNEKKR